MHTVYFSIGTNLGNRNVNISDAITLLISRVGRMLKQSTIYETQPWGFDAEGLFLNLVTIHETKLSAEEVLQTIMQIENQLGRIRTGVEGYESRLIDIDILLFDTAIIKSVELTVPHPLIQDRRFVLEPLVEVCGALQHPLLKVSFTDLLGDCKDKTLVYKQKKS